MSLIPFDESGTLATNLKTETHTVSAINGVNLNYIVPEWAPFFKAGCSIFHVESGEYLVEGVDFIFSHYFQAAEDYIAKAVYGSITLLDPNITGTFKISLQSLGGDLVDATTQLIEDGMSTLIDLQTVLWDDLPDVPTTFPATEHNHIVEDIEGATEVEAGLALIRQALVAQFTELSLADITDLQAEAIDPLLTALSNLSGSILSNGFNSSLTAYTASQAGADLDIGAMDADTWTDLPLTFTVTASGTYYLRHDMTHDTDAAAEVRYRWTIDGAAIDESLLNGYPVAIPAGSVLRVQVMLEGASGTVFKIASANTGSSFIAIRIGN